MSNIHLQQIQFVPPPRQNQARKQTDRQTKPHQQFFNNHGEKKEKKKKLAQPEHTELPPQLLFQLIFLDFIHYYTTKLNNVINLLSPPSFPKSPY